MGVCFLSVRENLLWVRLIRGGDSVRGEGLVPSECPG